MRVLLDTHVWAWVLLNDTVRLSQEVLHTIAEADEVFVSPMSVFEIGQKVRLGKWPEMEPFVRTLADLLIERGGRFSSVTPAVCLTASLIDWDNRDPFDRLIAATAVEQGLQLISADEQFDRLNGQKGWVTRLW